MTKVAQLAMVAILAALVGCRRGAATGDAGGDGSQEGGTGPMGCLGPTICDGTAVRACQDGQLGEVLQECAPERLCSLGRCSSSACAEAEGNVASLEGCTFYTFDLDNVDHDDPLPTSVILTNPGQAVATATLERRVRGDWVAIAGVDVAPMRSATFALPESHQEGEGAAPGGAFRVTSTLPLTAMHLQSDDSTPQGSTSSGGTMLLPAHTLGLRYRALTFVQTATSSVLGTSGARGGAGQIVVVATRDHTGVAVTASAKGAFQPPDAGVVESRDTIHLTLDDGDLYQIFGLRDGDDLTGTEIVADKPVAVFSGNISTTYGVTAMGISSPDLAHEQLLPVASWGRSYVAAQLPPQQGVCDPLLDPPGSSIWRILADKDDTVVTFSRSTAPGTPPPPPRMLRAGESFQVTLPGSFTVSATRPVLVMQGMDCEPTLSSAVPTMPWLTDYRFAVLPRFDTMIALVRRAGRPVYYDGARIEEGEFAKVADGFDVARIPIEACSPGEGVCTHHVEGQFGFTMRGMDVQSSYALTAPTWVPCIDPSVPGCVN